MKEIPKQKIELVVTDDSAKTIEGTAEIKKIETKGKLRGTMISGGKIQTLTEKDIKLKEEI